MSAHNPHVYTLSDIQTQEEAIAVLDKLLIRQAIWATHLRPYTAEHAAARDACNEIDNMIQMERKNLETMKRGYRS